jgi:hypothetical protein
MRFVFLFPVLFLPMCFAQNSPTPTPAPSTGTGIEGVISVSPSHGGPTRIGEANSRAVANVTFDVQNEKEVVATFTTDEQGHFRVSVPRGHYKVSRSGRKSSIGNWGPFDVDVAAGQMTKVEWTCDSGMR